MENWIEKIDLHQQPNVQKKSLIFDITTKSGLYYVIVGIGKTNHENAIHYTNASSEDALQRIVEQTGQPATSVIVQGVTTDINLPIQIKKLFDSSVTNSILFFLCDSSTLYHAVLQTIINAHKGNGKILI